MGKTRFMTLDALRGVAAISVMIFHYRVLLPHGGKIAFVRGYLAVDLFFALSGFVIAHVYGPRIAKGMKLGEFYRVRFLRLAPMIWLGLLIGALVAMLGGTPMPVILIEAVFNSLLLPSPFANASGYLSPINGPEWSLLYEMLANLAYIAFFPFLTRRRLAVVVAIGAVGLAVSAALTGSLGGGYTYPMVGVGLARVTFSFFGGVLLRETYDVWAPRTPRIPAWVVLAVGGVLLLPPVTGAAKAIYDFAFVVVASPLLIMAAAANEPPSHRLKIAEALGLLSFPLYAFHVPVCDLVKLAAPWHTTISLALSVAAMVGSVAFALWIARPEEAVRRRLTARSRALA